MGMIVGSRILDYYREPGPITDLGKYRDFTRWLAPDPRSILQTVQGLIIHDSWVDRYGIPYDPSHEYPQKTAYMADLLDKALELNPGSLAIPRQPGDRVIACCREFATLMCALLRAKGIPARSRCGFWAYTGRENPFEDHWICEYWDGNRWVMADPQIDPLQLSFLYEWSSQGRKDEITAHGLLRLNPHDLTEADFMIAGRAWLACREGRLDPARFGIGCPIRPEWGIDSLYGLWFVRGQLLRDFAALNKVETVPYLVRIARKRSWSSWRLVAAKDADLTGEDWALLDRIAALAADADRNFKAVRAMYDRHPDLQVPAEIIAR